MSICNYARQKPPIFFHISLIFVFRFWHNLNLYFWTCCFAMIEDVKFFCSQTLLPRRCLQHPIVRVSDRIFWNTPPKHRGNFGVGRICVILHDLTSVCIRYQGLESIDNGHWSSGLSGDRWLVVSNGFERCNFSLLRFQLWGSVSS